MCTVLFYGYASSVNVSRWMQCTLRLVTTTEGTAEQTLSRVLWHPRVVIDNLSSEPAHSCQFHSVDHCYKSLLSYAVRGSTFPLIRLESRDMILNTVDGSMWHVRVRFHRSHVYRGNAETLNRRPLRRPKSHVDRGRSERQCLEWSFEAPHTRNCS